MEYSEKMLIKQYALVLNKAWKDEEFKKALLADPKKTLADEGMEFPDSLEISITDGQNVQSYDASKNLLVLPMPMSPDPLTTEEVVSGEACCCCCPCCSCC